MSKVLLGILVFTSLCSVGEVSIAASAGFDMNKINNTDCLRGSQCGGKEFAGLLNSMGEPQEGPDLANKSPTTTMPVVLQVRLQAKNGQHKPPLNPALIYLHEDRFAPNEPSYYSIDLSGVMLELSGKTATWDGKKWYSDGGTYHMGQLTVEEATKGYAGWQNFLAGKAPWTVKLKWLHDSNLKLNVHPGNRGKQYRKLRLPELELGCQLLQWVSNDWLIKNYFSVSFYGTYGKNPRMNDRRCDIQIPGQQGNTIKVKFKEVEGNAVGTLEQLPFKLQVNCTGWREPHPQSGFTLGIYGTEISNVVSDIKLETVNPMVNIDGQNKIALFKGGDTKQMSNSMYVEGSFTSGMCGTDPLAFNVNFRPQLYVEKGAPWDDMSPTTKDYGTLYWRLCKKDNKIIESDTYTGQAKISIKYN